MTTPREIIADAKIDLFGATGETAADIIIETLTNAGYHIMTDADLAARDDAVLERAARELEMCRNMLSGQTVVLDIEREVTTYNIGATAIRALKGGKP